MGREHLGLVLRKAVGLADHVEDGDEIISYRGAVIGLIGSAAIMVFWLWLSGIPILEVLAFLFFVLVVFVSLTQEIRLLGCERSQVDVAGNAGPPPTR